MSSYVCSQSYGHKNGSFFVFSADTNKKSAAVWRKNLRASKRSYLAGLLDSELPLAIYQPLKIQSFIIFLLTEQFSEISNLNYSQKVTPKPGRTQKNL